jgi:uncharacterized protein
MIKRVEKWKTLLGSSIIALFILSACSGLTGKKNRLQYASSPYLQQHADNPVDWYEWGDEALNKAKKENKPLLISIGYASCHWCHEMEKESFMDTAVARIMNEKFVCIKIDREERPDIDNIYMNALQLISGNAGWPLNAFALPDGKPFFAGTYYTNKNWKSLLQSISKAYTTQHSLVVTQANALVNGMNSDELKLIVPAASASKPVMQEYKILYDSVYKKIDLHNGGLKGTQKFPTPALTEFLLQHYYLTGDTTALKAATTNLNKMALGGIYDHIGGGFARYTTDSLWRVPHFEKMLYDNGQLISLYAHAYQLTKNELYKEVITETIGFIEKSMHAQGGGYYSSLNADTEAGEGEYYLWKKKDWIAVLGNDPLITDYFNVAEKGNWKNGNNILYAVYTPATYAMARKIKVEELKQQLARAKAKLLIERNKRKKPAVDTKIIAAWNGILIKGYADAYAATGTEEYLQKAKACASFIEQNLLMNDGSIKRVFKDGKATVDGFLDDYAWTASAFIRLYEASFDQHWMDLAQKIAAYVTKHFSHTETNLFYYTRSGTPHLIMKKTAVTDDDLPSANAVMAKVLYNIGTAYHDTAYTSRAHKMLATVTPRIKKFADYHIQWAALTGLLAAKSYEVVVMGKDALQANRLLLEYYLPTSLILGSTEKETLPLMQQKYVAGKTMIYVCTNQLCKRPEEEVPRAIDQIKP